jgi:hypothetical protein
MSRANERDNTRVKNRLKQRVSRARVDLRERIEQLWWLIEKDLMEPPD